MKTWVLPVLAGAAVFLHLALADALAETELGIGAGYRVENFDWNIAGNMFGENPNILSELTWEDLEVYQTRVLGRVTTKEDLALKISAVYGVIVDGENQDSDYAGDNRTLEFSRSNNSTDEGDTLDLSVAVGQKFRSGSGRFSIVPMVGISYHELNLNITDGFQTIPPTGPFPGLNSTYDATWFGPWVGMDLSFKKSERFALKGGLELHWPAVYEAEADWNLRSDLVHPVSFRHESDNPAESMGLALSIGGEFVVIEERWLITLDLNSQVWSMRNGKDTVYFADGTSAATRLNEVNRYSTGVTLGMTFRF